MTTRIVKPEHAGPMRWARFTFPDGTSKDVLQQRFVREWEERDGNSTHMGADVEWRDVPVFHVCWYKSAQD